MALINANSFVQRLKQRQPADITPFQNVIQQSGLAPVQTRDTSGHDAFLAQVARIKDAKRRAREAEAAEAAANAQAQQMSLGANMPGIPMESMPAGSVGEAGFQQALQSFLAASGGKIKVTSGKRSTQRQSQLWEQALKKYGSPAAARKWVAPPGRSKHEIGLAADLRFATPAERAWAHSNAARFGLTFPLGNEPWHIEPLGARGGKKHKHK